MTESLLIIATDELLKCSFCNSKLKNPLCLPCFHSFCSDCIRANYKTDSQSVNCPKCFSDQRCANGVENTFKPSSLCNFFVKLNETKEKDEKKETEIEKEGVCVECPANKSLLKTNNTKGGENKEEQKPLQVNLSLCHHCKKDLCSQCRTKHHNQVTIPR